MVEAHQVEGALELHRRSTSSVGKVLDADQHIAAHGAKFARQPLPGSRRQLLELGQARCLLRSPILAASHACRPHRARLRKK